MSKYFITKFMDHYAPLETPSKKVPPVGTVIEIRKLLPTHSSRWTIPPYKYETYNNRNGWYLTQDDVDNYMRKIDD